MKRLLDNERWIRAEDIDKVSHIRNKMIQLFSTWKWWKLETKTKVKKREIKFEDEKHFLGATQLKNK